MVDSLQVNMNWTPANVDPRYLELSDEYGQYLLILLVKMMVFSIRMIILNFMVICIKGYFLYG